MSLSKSIGFFLTAGLFACFHAWLLPSSVIVFNDDFGYLQSVVQTLQTGNLCRSDWLEPWSVSLTLLSAMLWKATGSFAMATQGLQIIAMALGCWALCRILSRRGLSPVGSAVVAFLILTSPTILFKQVEFTAMALYLPCLLLAIDAVDLRRWGLFCLWCALATASRQSAILWLVFPLWELTRTVFVAGKHKRPVDLGATVPLLVVPILFALLWVFLPKTHAQEVMQGSLWQSLKGAQLLQTWAMFLPCAVVCSGLGTFVLPGSEAKDEEAEYSWAKMQLTRAVSGVGVAALVLCFLFGKELSKEHSLYQGELGVIYLIVMASLGILGLMRRRFVWDPAMVIAAVLSGFLISLRSQIWDYYLLDGALFAFLAAAPRQSMTVLRTTKHRPLGFWFGGALGCLAVFHIAFILETKNRLDETRAVVVLHEQALRNKSVSVQDLSLAPFGFQGWNLYAHFVATRGPLREHIAAFSRYIRPTPLKVQTRGQGDRTPLENEDEVVARGAFRIGNHGVHEFILRKPKNQGEDSGQTESLENFQRPWFPLNDQEWRELIDSKATEKTR